MEGDDASMRRDERASFRDQLWQIIVLSAVMRYWTESVIRTASAQP